MVRLRPSLLNQPIEAGKDCSDLESGRDYIESRKFIRRDGFKFNIYAAKSIHHNSENNFTSTIQDPGECPYWIPLFRLQKFSSILYDMNMIRCINQVNICRHKRAEYPPTRSSPASEGIFIAMLYKTENAKSLRNRNFLYHYHLPHP